MDQSVSVCEDVPTQKTGFAVSAGSRSSFVVQEHKERPKFMVTVPKERRVFLQVMGIYFTNLAPPPTATSLVGLKPMAFRGKDKKKGTSHENRLSASQRLNI